MAGRSIPRNRVAGITDLILLTNTDEGDAWSIAFKVERPYRDRFFCELVLSLRPSRRSILDGTSSQAASNWGNVYVPGDPNEPPLARSNFDPGHRITVSGGYDIPMPAGLTARVAVFYSGQSGRPWSANLRLRCQRRRPRHQRPALYPDAPATTIVLHEWHLRGSADFVNAKQCLSDSSAGSTSATPAASPWINTFDMKFTSACRFARRR